MNFFCHFITIALLTSLGVSNLAQAKVELDRSSGPTGVYRLDDGRVLYLAPLVDENGATLQFALSDGLVGRARRRSPDHFSDEDACVHQLVVAPEQVEFTDCRGRHTARLSKKIEERLTSFVASDGQTISASIWRGEGGAPRAGVVLAHGADDETRQMGVIIPQLIDAGLAIMSFDQRGAGESGGNWRSDGISRIADDVAQAAQLLQKEAQVESVGFFGFSNGGWVAPAAAVRFKTPAFVVIKSGDSQSVEQNVLFETRAAVERHSGAAAAQRAQEVMASLLKALHSDLDADWSSARQKLAEVQGQTWLQYTQLPPANALPLPDPVKHGYRRQLFFDPRDDLKKLTCPVLILLGDLDIDVDGPRSAALYRQYFDEAANQRTTIALIKGAGHQLVKDAGPAANNSMATGYYAQQYPGEMISWLKWVNRR